MKRILFLAFTIASFNLYGQDTTFYDSTHTKVNSINDAWSYQILTRFKNDTNRVIEKGYYKSGKIMSWCQYSNYFLKIAYGKQLEFYPDGKQKMEMEIVDGKRNGLLKTWYENGQLRRKDSFQMGEFIYGKCFTSSGADTTYFEFAIQPSFPGGEEARQKFLADNIIYPDSARENGIQGTVYLSFVVEKDGSLSNIELVAGDKMLAKESIRVVKLMPKWNPGYHEGELARVKINMPIKFVVVD